MKLVRTIVAALLASLMLAGHAFAEFMLDSRFTDADGDLIADIPTDQSQLVDPDTPIAVACAGFRPFAMMAAEDGSFGYEMEIITYPDSGIESVEDITGKQMAFTQETSNSGFKAPSALLKSEFGMEAGNDFEPVFSGSHDTSIIGVANQDYPAAAIANSVKARMIERDVVEEDQLKVIYTSQTFPTTGYGVVYNLTPELQEKIQEAFFSFPWEGSALAEEFSKSGEAQFVEITFQDDWAVIRQIDEANRVSYACQ